ncbi:DUF2092 domain-containing protein [Uliginosibacterium sp. sgz301328]|uniref:DUF2092 domain-containing protein n=1 Tax=Uliginosibacterium sp. sgz301328 TaxID=3243764 RepID=UPI00359DF69C
MGARIVTWGKIVALAATTSSLALAAEPAVSPEAVAALKAMGAYLRSLDKISVTADASVDYVDDDGQVLTFGFQHVVDVDRPDRLRASIRGDDTTRTMYYDGKTFTLYGTQHNYYASVPAPPTIRQLVDDLATKYGIQTPLADLFYWGLEDHDAGADLTSARKIGDERIGDATCTHYAFRQPNADWQLWIRTGAQPLPCRLVIADRSNGERPRYSVAYHWQTKPTFTANTFRFVPPKGAARIVLAPREAAASSSSAR